MKDIVVVPAWRRSEFLALTLQRLSEAPLSHEHHVVITLDRGYDDEVLRVATLWQHPDVVILVRTADHGYRGNSFNVLEGFRYALGQVERLGSELIYTIEEDIWVAKDFFTLHRLVHKSVRAFAFCAALNQPSIDPVGTTSIEKPPLPQMIYAHPFFQSYGASFPIWAIQRILGHAVPDYYADMHGYIAKTFDAPDCRRIEQDGLITQTMQQEGYKTYYPYLPRAMHAGFHGYNRPGQPLKGDFAERVLTLQNLTAARMNERAAIYKDIHFCAFEHNPIDRVEIEEET